MLMSEYKNRFYSKASKKLNYSKNFEKLNYRKILKTILFQYIFFRHRKLV